jgi:hypothetical protein
MVWFSLIGLPARGLGRKNFVLRTRQSQDALAGGAFPFCFGTRLRAIVRFKNEREISENIQKINDLRLGKTGPAVETNDLRNCERPDAPPACTRGRAAFRRRQFHNGRICRTTGPFSSQLSAFRLQLQFPAFSPIVKEQAPFGATTHYTTLLCFYSTFCKVFVRLMASIRYSDVMFWRLVGVRADVNAHD